MKFNKKVLGPAAVVIGLIVTVLSFQNCSQGQTSSSSSTSDLTTTSSVNALSYPSTSTPVFLVAGQSVTLKIAKPAAMSDSTSYEWYVYNDGNALDAHIGLPVESNGYLYVSLTVRSDLSSTQDLRIYFYNWSTSTYLDGNGVWIRLSPSATSTPYSGDAVSEMCSVRSSYVPSFNFSRSTAVTSALNVFDNGAGVATLTCTFTDSSGTNYGTVDCVNTASWPSNWASLSLNVYSTNRCGTSYSQSF